MPKNITGEKNSRGFSRFDFKVNDSEDQVVPELAKKKGKKNHR